MMSWNQKLFSRIALRAVLSAYCKYMEVIYLTTHKMEHIKILHSFDIIFF